MANIEQQLPNQHLWAFYETSGGSVNISRHEPPKRIRTWPNIAKLSQSIEWVAFMDVGEVMQFDRIDENIAEPHANIRKRTLREYEDIMFLFIHI